eukprot:1141340-Pelagomonas_calceolata.AAC.1
MAESLSPLTVMKENLKFVHWRTGQNEHEATERALWLYECQDQLFKRLQSVRDVDEPTHT